MVSIFTQKKCSSLCLQPYRKTICKLKIEIKGQTGFVWTKEFSCSGSLICPEKAVWCVLFHQLMKIDIHHKFYGVIHPSVPKLWETKEQVCCRKHWTDHAVEYAHGKLLKMWLGKASWHIVSAVRTALSKVTWCRQWGRKEWNRPLRTSQALQESVRSVLTLMYFLKY